MSADCVNVRDEAAAEVGAVHSVIAAAFEREDEARLVDRLRGVVSPIVNLVAERSDAIVGHILFTPVTVEGNADTWQAMALGPMAVRPDMQRQGIGSALVNEGLQRCEALNTPAVFVLGHPAYYPRFGFVPASRYGCCCQWAVPDDVFMVLPIAAQQPCAGRVQYHPLFDEVS